MSQKRKGFMTLAEHEALLKAEGRYEATVERKRQLEEQRQQRVEELRKAQAPLVEDLRAAGYDVTSAWGLVSARRPYPDALPILLRHLERPYPGEVREIIARALAVPAAKFAWPMLLKHYRAEQDTRAKDGLAVAIAAVADEELIGDVIALARDSTLGPSRLLLLRALEKSQDPRALETLEELERDPDLYKEIRVILRRLQRR